MTEAATEHTVTPVWIDPSWLSWEVWGGRAGNVLNDANLRPYEVHQHACDILASNPNKFHRVDAIITLRRVVGRRVKELMEIYHLRELPTGTKPKYDLELLEFFGIIRPFMLRELIDIRNFVEHQDSSPPPTDECLVFADLVWYFLRSTDYLVHAYVEEIEFESPRMGGRGFPKAIVHFRQSSVHSGVSFVEPGIQARLEASSLAYEPRTHWLRIMATGIDEYEATVPVESTSSEYDEIEISAVYLRGKVDGTDEQMRHLYQLYFKVSHFS